ncbi:MAG: 2-oxo acid dehydrogenase subunit E2 [Deltaproteobacteria bacterium]|nr:2-oxo acid dehydrogenase subunit E2 [Deltaproteobacteria bacterium]
MLFEFKLPDIGEGIVEGELVKWLVSEGDDVAEDQPLAEVMTDKATVTIPSPKRGKVVARNGKEGEIVKVHSTLVVIEVAGAGAVAKSNAGGNGAGNGARATASAPAPAMAARIASTPATATNDRPLATPATRRYAREKGVDISTIKGSGPDGRITREDIDAAGKSPTRAIQTTSVATTAPASAPKITLPDTRPSSPTSAAGDERIAIRGIRKRISEKMTQSRRTAAHYTYVDEIDVTELVRLRENARAIVESEGIKLTYLPFIIQACVMAFRKYPTLNAHVDDAKAEVVVKKAVHMGIGTATDAGLVVTVVRNADARKLKDLAVEIARLAESARRGQAKLEEMTGSTFTITSLGAAGGIFATPIINYPEVAIMGVHKIEKRAVVVNDQIVARDRMNLSLSFDHRIIDGHVGAAFTAEVKRILENPTLLFLHLV